MMTHSNDFAGSSRSTHPGVRLALIVTAAVAVYACDRAASPTAPTMLEGLPTVDVTPGVTTLCQIGLGATFKVHVGVIGTARTPQGVTVADGQCANVATVDPARRDDVVVSIEEDSAGYYALDRIVLQHGDEAPRAITGTNTVGFEGTHGAVVTFFNNAAVNVCEAGPSATFQFQVGLDDAFHALSLANGQCSRIATIRPASADDVIVTVRQDASPTRRVDLMTLTTGALSPQTITGASSVSFEGLHGATVTFHTVPVP